MLTLLTGSSFLLLFHLLSNPSSRTYNTLTSREKMVPTPQPKLQTRGSISLQVPSAASRPFLPTFTSKPLLSRGSCHQLMPCLPRPQFCLLTSHHSIYLIRTGNQVKLLLLLIPFPLFILWNMDDFYNNETLDFLYSKTLCPLYLSCPVSWPHLECSTSAHLLLDCT